ncbi:hypothetical protein EMCRGX_G027884 [Ephydatia muelleri]
MLSVQVDQIKIQDVLQFEPSTLFVLLGHQASIRSKQTFILMTPDLRSVLEVNANSGRLTVVPFDSLNAMLSRHPLAHFSIHGPLDNCYLAIEEQGPTKHTCTVAVADNSLVCGTKYTRLNIRSV